jgi:RNA polymerase sigma-70 factor (sigma-E family)
MTTGGPWAGGPGQDQVLGRLYQQVSDWQAARFSAGYDLAAGLHRYGAWLREHADDPAALDADLAARPLTLQASQADAGPAAAEAVNASVTMREPAASPIPAPGGWAGLGPDRAVSILYRAHYRSLVRLAAFLVRDTATAEEVVQDAFVALHGAWHRMKDADQAVFYLRRSVVNRSRSELRHQAVVDKIAPQLTKKSPGAGPEPASWPGRTALISALPALPSRQREALMLRYHAGLTEAQIASAMGISRGAVRSHTARALSALRAELRKTTD